MTSVELSVDTATIVATGAPAQPARTGVVNVYCVEVTPENTEKMRKLLERVRGGEVPTADALAKAGMKGIELTAGVDTTVEEICGVVEQQRLSALSIGSPSNATAARVTTTPTQIDGMHLTFFAVSRGTNEAQSTTAATDDDPLVALPQELSLEEALKCQQIFVTHAAGTEATAPTLLLFYTMGTKWGTSCCCCCGDLVAAIMAFCGHRRTPSRPRPQRHSGGKGGNPLNNGGGSDGNYCPNTQAASYPANNTCYTQYGYANNSGYNNTVNYAGVPQPQLYYPPPPMSGGSSNSDGGAYYKPI